MRNLLALRVTSYIFVFASLLAPTFLRARDAQSQKLIAISPEPQKSSHSSQDTGQPSLSMPNVTSGQAISLPRIAARAQELSQQLRDMGSQLTSKSELLDASKEAQKDMVEVRARASETNDLLADNPTPMELEDEQRYWRWLSQGHRTHGELLAAVAVKRQEQIQFLDSQLQVWEATWDQIHNLLGIDAVIEQVRKALEAIRATRSQVNEQLGVVLTLQNQISEQDQLISDVLVWLRQRREETLNRLLEPDSPHIWKVLELPQLNHTAAAVFHRSLDRSLSIAKEFLRTKKTGVLILPVLFLVLLWGVRELRRRADGLERSFSLALLLALLLAMLYAGSAPIALTFALHLLFVVPAMRLLLPLLDPGLRVPLYVATFSYAAMGLYLLVQLPPPIKREVHALMVLAAIVGFGWILRLFRTRPSIRCKTTPIQRIGIRVCVLLLTASLIANIVGYVSLSQMLSLAPLLGPFIAAALYCAARVLALLLSTVFRLPWLTKLPEETLVAIEHWVGRLLSCGALFLWLAAMLRLLTIYDHTKNAVLAFLRRPIGFEKFNFTLSGAFTVIVILLVGYLLANIFAFLLQNFVLARWKLKRGLPYAISKVSYYFCLVVVGLTALSTAGVELNKFTVLTGAIGVGLGFGMQNIVNNFVSGLILIFERPIHVGDIVDVGGLEGTVRRIGARSSTVVTSQGAEVIVPNSNLLSNQLVNWTLSSQWRRLDIPVRVAYGTDPEQVVKLLVSVAECHPGVLLQRPPAAFFQGFGESALNFELRFWSAQQDTWLHLLSDVTIAVAKALCEAGIEIPFPQRDLHVRSVDMLATRKLNRVLKDAAAPDHSVST